MTDGPDATTDGGQRRTDDGETAADGGPDPEVLAEMAERVEAIADSAAALREMGEAHDVPAVERNAERVAAVVGILEANLPPELREE